MNRWGRLVWVSVQLQFMPPSDGSPSTAMVLSVPKPRLVKSVKEPDCDDCGCDGCFRHHPGSDNCQCFDRLDNTDDHGCEQKRFLFSITYQYSSDSLDAASVSDVVTNTVALSSVIQANCITTARCLQSSGTTAWHAGGDNEIDLAGSEGLERMKVDNIKPRGPFHVPRWSLCDRVPSPNDVWSCPEDMGTHGYADQSLVVAVNWTTNGSADAGEGPVTVRFVLGVLDLGFFCRCLVYHHWQPVAFERAAARGL